MTAVQLVPVEKIRVINARSRNKTKFREIIENISKVGLKKPITVSRRDGDDGPLCQHSCRLGGNAELAS